MRAIMANAITNVRPTHLLDREVRDAWLARPHDVRPKPERAEHFTALPARRKHLPVVSS